jgi:hypothetical protein
LINTLHPGRRLSNSDCRDLRHFSNLARGMAVEEATLRPQGLGKAQHAEYSADRINGHRKKPTSFPYSRPENITVDKNSTPSRSLAADTKLRLLDPEQETLPENFDRMDGVRHILPATDTGAIANLLDAVRGAYSLSSLNYTRDWDGSALICAEIPNPSKPTI